MYNVITTENNQVIDRESFDSYVEARRAMSRAFFESFSEADYKGSMDLRGGAQKLGIAEVMGREYRIEQD